MSYYPPGVTGAEPFLTGMPEPEECEHCHGAGIINERPDGGSLRECAHCEGNGTITPEPPEPEWEPPEERG